MERWLHVTEETTRTERGGTYTAMDQWDTPIHQLRMKLASLNDSITSVGATTRHILILALLSPPLPPSPSPSPALSSYARSGHGRQRLHRQWPVSCCSWRGSDGRKARAHSFITGLDPECSAGSGR